MSSRPSRALRRAGASLLIAALLASALPAQHELQVEGVPPGAPFRVAAWADASRLVVELSLHKDWHAYSKDVGGGEPISLAFEGESIRPVGALRLPKSENGELHGRVRIEQWIRAKPGARLVAKLHLMVCDAMECLPPLELTLRGKIAPLRVLLVTSARDAHAERIARFLESRAMRVTTALYGDVDAATCDAHDVVLAASKLFREDGKGGRAASKFAKTKSPILAVGFLGTQLIEKHGLAMTSGYI